MTYKLSQMKSKFTILLIFINAYDLLIVQIANFYQEILIKVMIKELVYKINLKSFIYSAYSSFILLF